MFALRANNRMSGPALLAGGARCAPPSGLDPSAGFALPHTPRADMESAPTVQGSMLLIDPESCSLYR